MQAYDGKIVDFISNPNTNIVVPVYQRPYSWKKANCVQLWNDIVDVYENNYSSHFFGSIVFVENNVRGLYERIIIDGQQRVTTVSLLLLAIRDYLLKSETVISGINLEDISNKLLKYKVADKKYEIKLKLVEGDDKAYEALVNDLKPVKNSAITENYNYFYGEVSKRNEEQIAGIYESISKLYIANIQLNVESGDDPQLIFESMNSTGLALQESDKIRNYVLMGFKAEEQKEVYKQYWQPIENTVGRELMNKFIKHYLTLKNKNTVADKRLYVEFKIFNEKQQAPIETVLKDVREYAEYYVAIKNPSEGDGEYSKALVRINKLEVETSIPLLLLLLKVYHDGKINEKELCTALEIVENYIVRRIICNLSSSGLNKTFPQVCGDVEKGMANENADCVEALKTAILKLMGKTRFPLDAEFEDCFINFELYNSKPAFRKYVFERLTNFGNKEIVDVEKGLEEQNLTIEHVMPQKLTPRWRKDLGDNYDLIHQKYLNTVGNLTLIAYNSEFGNRPFSEKKTLTDDNGKLIGFNASSLTLNDYIKKCDEWGEKQIVGRAEKLYKDRAQKIWWLPKTEAKVESDGEWIEWDEEFDFTGKDIVKIDVFDDMVGTDGTTDAYKKVNQMLYDLDPTMYFNINENWFSDNETDLRMPYKLSENAFIETNKNNQDKIKVIRKVARHCDLGPSDVRFFVKEKKSKE